MFQQPALRQLPRAVRGPAHFPRRTFLSIRPERPSHRAVEGLNVRELSKKSKEYERNRRIFLWSGTIAGITSFAYTAYRLQQELSKPVQLDSGLPSTDPLSHADAAERKVVVRDADGHEMVPTGNSTVQMFPRTIDIPSYTSSSTQGTPSTTLTEGNTEYTLVGLGTRTVTFVGIQVYVVGYYIATADIATFQNALTKKINPIATALVPGERDELRSALLDPVEGEATWDALLASGIPARSVFRVVPTRDTDFHHLRDGFVRAIQARAPALSTKAAATGHGTEADDEAFAEAMRQFRGIFSRGSVPKRKELLLLRDGRGVLSIAYDDGGSKKESRPASRQLIGSVEDERVSRALWLNYLAGSKVASEPARKNIVEGIMEFVERPVGTVAAQVV
ncbi:chalcone-flavanone isomerase-domain-containing protein [Lasiosphaeria hispida]|uniref:Chalcone-flavanone isomerase-domain-containing protein n=1 Tax=Lasiosphaeria hispida TaxID=260671 RepID=A0AAJ0MHU7_9PEZI|nr:chalcone-flavanone isomerase-domain-containing protein [Lasiosphaeria hispida]